MIVLDEQLRDAQIRREFARWYKGTITTINDLRPRTRILDDVVPTLLRTGAGWIRRFISAPCP